MIDCILSPTLTPQALITTLHSLGGGTCDFILCTRFNPVLRARSVIRRLVIVLSSALCILQKLVLLLYYQARDCYQDISILSDLP